MKSQQALTLIVMGAAACLASMASHACDLKVESAWIRSAPPAASTLAGYATLTNTGSSTLKITDSASPSAQMAMLHETAIVNGVAQMRMLDSLSIPPGGHVLLAPGGKHLMLMGLKSVPKSGDHLTIVFTDSTGCATSTLFAVRPSAP
jgi:copper(I)-binding protein